MSDYIHQLPSPTVHTVTPEVIAQEFNHLAIDVNRPDSESAVSADQSGTALSSFIGSGLTELSEGDEVYGYIKEKFVSRLGALGVTVVAIHQNCYSSIPATARAQAFEVCSQAVQKKGGGDTANVRDAWYATLKDEVSKILSNGFGYGGMPENNGLHGCGAYFAPVNHPLESIKSAPVDKDGLQHLLLCRVILGKSELVDCGSEQSRPSSEQYDSGVDDLSSPRRYIIWSSHMNTHVLPMYVVSFKASSCLSDTIGSSRTPETSQKPNSPWIPIPILISEVSKILPPSDVSLISKYYEANQGGKISRHVLVRKVRQITGDRLLIRIIKSVRAKQSGA